MDLIGTAVSLIKLTRSAIQSLKDAKVARHEFRCLEQEFNDYEQALSAFGASLKKRAGNSPQPKKANVNGIDVKQALVKTQRCFKQVLAKVKLWNQPKFRILFLDIVRNIKAEALECSEQVQDSRNYFLFFVTLAIEYVRPILLSVK